MKNGKEFSPDYVGSGCSPGLKSQNVDFISADLPYNKWILPISGQKVIPERVACSIPQKVVPRDIIPLEVLLWEASLPHSNLCH